MEWLPQRLFLKLNLFVFHSHL